jgi:predicted nucleotidyltransferase component of viral defense system
MRELQDLEKFEMETLRVLNQIRMLDKLFFGGGTMLRLCHNLNRYSTDLDFWMKSTDNAKDIFWKIHQSFSNAFTMKDAEEKTNTLIFEINTPESVRNLVVEIRKDQSGFDWERKIAFSSISRVQVAVKALTLEQMMKNKIKAFLARRLIRDCFDIEFLLFRGVSLSSQRRELYQMIEIVESFKERDFKVALGSLLEDKDRKFCIENQFQFLKEEIRKQILSNE